MDVRLYSFIKKSQAADKLSIFESLSENSFIHLLTFFFFLALPSLPGFSLQDSFEYINQDPNLGKLNTNQNNLGPCRTGSNLGKISPMNGLFLSEYHCCGCVFCFIWVCCVVLGFLFLFCIILNLCLFFCVYFVCPPLCVSVPRSAAGMQQQATAGGDRRRTSPAHPECFFLCRFVWNAEYSVTHTHINKSCAGS